MRRFSFMIFALAVLFAAASDGKRSTGHRSASGAPASPSSGAFTATGEATSAASVAAGAKEANGALIETAAMADAQPGALLGVAPADYIATAPVHIAASAKVSGIEPAVEALTGRNLTSALQGELKRLGCYEAEVDGKWGRKSQAAVKSFSERAGGRLANASRRELVAALRTYPAGFCASECAAKAEGGQCTVGVAPDAKAPVEAEKNSSYLPPWMQGGEPANAERSETALSIGRKPLPEVSQPNGMSKKGKSVRRRGGEREDRTVQRTERRQISSSEWMPEGWPRRR